MTEDSDSNEPAALPVQEERKVEPCNPNPTPAACHIHVDTSQPNVDGIANARADAKPLGTKESDEDEDGNDSLHQQRVHLKPHCAFPKPTRNFIVFTAAICGFISPLSGNIYFPALNALSADLHVTQSLVNISLTTYLIVQGLAPTFLGDLADTAGRRPAYIIGFTIYTLACMGLALQTSYPALLVLRAAQAAGSSSTIALASAVAADVAPASERGTYMGLVNGGALAGPALGPILGGILAQFLGWRAIFWFLVILGGAVLSLILLAFPETARNVVGDGSIPPPPWNRDLLSFIRERRRGPGPAMNDVEHRDTGQRRKFRFPNPLSTLKILREKDVALLLFYNALLYCAYYSVTSSLPYLFQATYGFNELQIGLSYIPYGFGALLASLCNGRILDWRFRQVAHSIGFAFEKGTTTDTRHFPLERVRFPIAMILLLVGNAALLCYGWVLQVHAPLAAPLVLLFLIGYCMNGGFNCCSIALVDYYPTAPATATAGNNLCRCLLGAGEAAIIIPMIEAMGRGWCFTFIALIIFATTPVLLVLMRWGPKWREERAQRVDAAKARMNGSRDAFKCQTEKTGQ